MLQQLACFLCSFLSDVLQAAEWQRKHEDADSKYGSLKSSLATMERKFALSHAEATNLEDDVEVGCSNTKIE